MAHPEHWLSQDEAARRISEVNGEPRRVSAVARGTQIERRAIALPPEAIGKLGSIEERNDIYRKVAPPLAANAARAALRQRPPGCPVGYLVTSSCTGYMVPGFDVQLVSELGLGPNTTRLPISVAGCAGGVVALARAADYLRSHPDQSALVVAVELCSLAFHSDTEVGNLTSALIFGDGAGAAVLEAGGAPLLRGGLELIESLSVLVPCSQDALGFALTDRGFYPRLTRELADILPAPTLSAVEQLLALRGIGREEVGFWLIHPGGSRILSGIEESFGLASGCLRWSWRAMREAGNTSSAAIFDVIRRYLEDGTAPRGWGVVIAFGPGVSVELLLVRRC